jgi:penicillin-binding protein 2
MFDWHRFLATEHRTTPAVDPRRRLDLCWIIFALLLLVVFGRMVQLEITQGAAFRSTAAEPLRRERSLPGVRGQILARDGAVLACDREILAVAVHYRYLQQPVDTRWLRSTARARLTAAERKDTNRLTLEENRLEAQRLQLASRLAGLCGITEDVWDRRARQIQTRVERIAERVNAETREKRSRESILGESASEPPVTVSEELQYHVMVEDVPQSVAAEIEGNPQQYPGVKIVALVRRSYPAGNLAAHVLGHVGLSDKNEIEPDGGADAAYQTGDYVGRMGLERQYEILLRGRRGLEVELTDHAGKVLETTRVQDPVIGTDLVTTLDCQLQRTAEELLDGALQRRAIHSAPVEPAGGAIVVMDVQTGALRAIASAPRFDPNWFASGKSEDLAKLQNDELAPMFDRASRMAIPPGSVFKTLTAAALLEAGIVNLREPLFCQGYLNHPDSQRCDIYVKRGIGHGDVTLADALCESCNVYFFHQAERLGPGPLIDWARKFGFGRPTGVDLPGESPGTLPSPENIEQLEGHRWRSSDTQSLGIGQGSLTTTPLQIVCMMAAIANGGQLVTPHLLAKHSQSLAFEISSQTPSAVKMLPDVFSPIREGLLRVVADPEGTAHATVYLDSVAVAGKTGTAETGENRQSHAWFAGYVPAERPKLAFVVVLEHAGESASTAGPVAKRLVITMQQLELF